MFNWIKKLLKKQPKEVIRTTTALRKTITKK